MHWGETRSCFGVRNHPSLPFACHPTKQFPGAPLAPNVPARALVAGLIAPKRYLQGL